MTLDPRTIEACANAMKAERERLIAQPLASVWRQLAEAAIRALASKTQSSDGGVEGHATEAIAPAKAALSAGLNAQSVLAADAGTCQAGIKPGPSETPAGAAKGSHPCGESDPLVMQDCAPAGAVRTTVRQLVDDPHSASGKSLRYVEVAASAGTERPPMQRFLAAAGWDAGSIRHKQLQDALDGANLAIIDRLTASSPAEVSEEELTRWLHSNAFAMVDAVMSPAKKESMIPLTRALLAKFIIGRRV